MSKKILIVDDDKDISSALANSLKANGYEVFEAHSGSEGLKKALTIKPDLLLLDVMMENDTAGFEAAAQLRSNRANSRYKTIKNTPIIMLTAINQVTNSRFSLSDKNNFLADINGFLTKPVNFDELLQKVRALIQS